MARTFTAIDACAIATELIKMATGQETLTKIDSSTFVSVGETLCADARNTLNNLSILIGKTRFAVRKRQDRFYLVESEDNDAFSIRMRKISYFSTNPENAGFTNTNLYTNLAQDFDNNSNPDATSGDAQSTASMWKQNYKVVLQLDFGGESVVDLSITIPEYAWNNAFTSAQSFADWLNFMWLELENDISRLKEQFNKMNLLNKIAGVYDLGDTYSPGSCINLTAAFNAKYRSGLTPYTSEELRTTYRSEFLAFFVETFKLTSEWLTYDTTKYHWTPPKTDAAGNPLALIRTTPYSKQRIYLYRPFFVESEASVLPQIFNPQYLNIETQYEGVMYWESIDKPAEIDVEPAIPDVSGVTGAQTKGNRVQIPYLLGVIFDRDGLMTNYRLDSSAVTPLEAKKMYRNHFWHIARGAVNDFTENCVIFYMQDPPAQETNNSTGTRAKKA